ncbi:MAG: ABC transporter permease [Gaiellaceae bacterium]
MFHLAWLGVRHNPARYVATLVAIVTGVAFFSATGFLSDRVLDALQGDVDRQYGNVDAAVIPDDKGAAADFADKLRISGASADAIEGASGVEATGGVLTRAVAFRSANGKVFGDGATGRLWIEDPDLNPIDVEEGEAPAAAGEIAVDKGLASKHDLTVGEKATLLTLAGPQQVTVVGITKFGSTDAIDGGGTVSISKANAFDWLSSGQVEFQELYVRGAGDQKELAAAIQPSVPAGFKVQDGSSFLADKRAEIGAPAEYLKKALQAFAILAMLVGGFVIYNTFSVIVSQRLRELAVMSAIGATPKQIKRSLRYEGIVIGVLGSLLGLLVGFALTFLLAIVLTALGVDLPGSGAKIGITNVVSAVLIGTIITVASVMIPARRAARTEPIEALRAAAVERSPFSRGRVIASVILVGGGIAGLLFGFQAAMLGIGAFALFIGVIVAGPFIAVAGATLLRPIMSLFGLEGRLAVDNTARSPQRTATTANALLIGVFLVTLISVTGTSAKDFVVGEIKKLETADYLIVSTGGTIGPDFVKKLEGIDGVDTVVAFRRESVTVDGTASQLFTGDIASLQKIAGIDAKSGSIGAVAPGTIALVETSDTPAMGSTVVVKNSTGESAQLKVVAILKTSLDTATTGSYVDEQTFDQLVGDTAPTVAFLDTKPNAQSETADAIEALAAQRPDISAQEGNAIGKLIGGIFDFIINAVNGLLVMSIIIALIGIINTLSLSIFERRRELGLLRAVGMTDDRVRRMVRLEAILISALGTVTGVVLGLFMGWSLIHAINRLSSANVALSLPYGRLGLVLVLGVVLGLLASLIPSRRSTKLDVLDAIQST